MEFKVGDKVKMNPESMFKSQGFRSGVSMIGKIYGTSGDWRKVHWSDDSKNNYQDRDLILQSNSEPQYDIY